MPNLIKSIKIARRKISKTMSKQSKIAYALLQFSRTRSGLLKTAYSDADIERAVQQHFRSEGIQNPPNLNWGKIFAGTVQRLSRMNNWDEGTEEQIMASAFSDILMGENIATGAQWSKGSLGQMIRDFQAAGKSDGDIERLLKRQVNQQALRHWERQKQMVRQHGDDVTTFDPTHRPDDEETGRELILDVLDMDPLSREQADHWMHVTERDPIILDMISKIDRFIEQNADQGVKLLWKTMKDNPEMIGNRSELGRINITYVDEEDGQQKTAPLYEALGKSKPSDLWYPEEKLVKLVDQIKPQIKQELEMA